MQGETASCSYELKNFWMLFFFFFFYHADIFHKGIGLKDRRKTFLPDVLPKNKQTNKPVFSLSPTNSSLSHGVL